MKGRGGGRQQEQSNQMAPPHWWWWMAREKRRSCNTTPLGFPPCGRWCKSWTAPRRCCTITLGTVCLDVTDVVKLNDVPSGVTAEHCHVTHLQNFIVKPKDSNVPWSMQTTDTISIVVYSMSIYGPRRMNSWRFFWLSDLFCATISSTQPA